MDRLVGCRFLFIEFTMGNPQPAKRDRTILVVPEKLERDNVSGAVYFF